MILSKKEIPRSEYPRPQFVRSIWFNLNGEWEFAFDDAEEGMSLGWYDGRELPLRINVPFGYQTELSGMRARFNFRKSFTNAICCLTSAPSITRVRFG
jgi:hypothetical protein